MLTTGLCLSSIPARKLSGLSFPSQPPCCERSLRTDLQGSVFLVRPSLPYMPRTVHKSASVAVAEELSYTTSYHADMHVSYHVRTRDND